MNAPAFRNRGVVLLAALALGACTTIPTGPSVMVLPGEGKHFDQFRFDDAECRQFALTQSGATAEDASTGSGVKSAAIGAGVGVVAGAVIGGRHGAAVGAGTGVAIGSVAGAGAAQSSGRIAQQRYDIGYQQCMYAKGHKIPSTARFERNSATPRYTAPPPPGSPPPGSPPPPR